MITYFINEAFDMAIKTYLDKKTKPNCVEFNSFLVVVIRSLVFIYGELDITTPYFSKKEELFDRNLGKYNYSDLEIEAFKKELENYLINEKNNVKPNPSFLEIEKMLINMFMMKKINHVVTKDEEIIFESLLYTPNNQNELMISYNFLHSATGSEVINYFKDRNEKCKKVTVETPKHLLTPDAYNVINKNYTDICLLSAVDVEKVNSEVYSALEVPKNAINHEYLLDQKLKEFYHKTEPVTSGNGYVDILLILGIICTIIMIIIIATIIF